MYYEEKLLYKKDIEQVLNNLKNEGDKIVFTNGCFDILHYGHIKYLWDASSLGDCLIVGINSDSSVRRIKGNNRPINNEQHRLAVIASLQMVNYVTLFSDDTPLELIKIVKPDVLVKGGDWKEDQIVGSDFVKSHKGKVVVIPYVNGMSTTKIISSFKN